MKVSTEAVFRFKEFSLNQQVSAMKVGTDGVLLGAWSGSASPGRILDIGAGCGIVTMMLAQRFSEAQVLGVEIDEATASEARSNAGASPFADRIEIVTKAIQDLDETRPFDLIVCNPPFFSGGTLSHNNSRTAVRHTTKLSHSDLLRSAQRNLSDGGTFCVILPILEGMRFIELAGTYGLNLVRKTVIHPRSGARGERLLLALSSRDQEVVEDKLMILNEDDSWSDDFWNLTGSFYLERK